MWFDTWAGLLRIVLVGIAAYVWLIFVLRISGKRTLAKLNAFDLVVTVALGSTLSTILLDSAVTWTEGAVALGVLVLAQLAVAFSTSKIRSLRTVVTARPTLLVRNGEIINTNLKRQRVAEAEIRQCLRSAGTAALGGASVVLETDGSMSVISEAKLGDGWALEDVTGYNTTPQPSGEDRRRLPPRAG